MLDVKLFHDILIDAGVRLFTGIPDSQLRCFCDYLMSRYGVSNQHIIGANEGGCLGIAAGHYLATGKPACVYMQNSGLGNIVNPYTSLTNEHVYSIPTVFVVGWRGEPMVKDEPQHVFQGEITLRQLELLNIDYMVISHMTQIEEIESCMDRFKQTLKNGESVAFVVKKDALVYEYHFNYENANEMLREEILEQIIDHFPNDICVSTTGKASRELFEIREKRHEEHNQDFLTVGSMGHSSMIALGIALEKMENRVWCFDGDGAMLMHMGSMAIIGSKNPSNYVHVVLNNAAHESVGGLPTVAGQLDITQIAQGCGYENIFTIGCQSELEKVLEKLKSLKGLTFIEIKTKIGARHNLGRPTTTPIENKEAFMQFLRSVSE